MQRENLLPVVELADSRVVATRFEFSGGERRPPRLGEMLVEAHKLSPRGLKRALRYQQKQPAALRILKKDRLTMRLGEVLLKLKLVPQEDISHALARQFSFPCLAPGSKSGLRRELVTAYRPFSRAAEAFRTLRTNILLRGYESGRKTLAVLSTGAGEGRSYVAANLAVAFAQMGKRTLLVDADLRRPRQDLIFDLPRHYGLSGVLGMPRNAEEMYRVPAVGELSVVPAGIVPPNPLELLSKAHFRNWLSSAQETFDMVLIDTPASALYMDTAVITTLSEGSLMVVRKDYTRLPDARQVIDSLASTGVPVVGTVLNRF